MSSPSLHAERFGSGPRLVLVHGFTQTGRCWGPVADELSRDHEVVLVDAPGHGESSDVRADLWEGATLLAESGGRATYAGYSMGARLALHLALSHPSLVDALVLVSGTPGIESAEERDERRTADEALADRIEAEGVSKMLDEWLSGPLFDRLPPKVAFREERERNTPDGLASSLRLVGTGTQDSLWGRLPELAMPVLVVAGAEDVKFSSIARRMVETIGSNATLAVLPNTGHSVPLESPRALLDAYRLWESKRRLST